MTGGLLHNFLSSVIYTALICVIALTLMPEGRIKKAGKIICGVAMVFAIISPFLKTDLSDYAERIAGYKAEAAALTQNGSEYSENLNRTYIEDKCEAYILDKAEKIGAEIYEVEVMAKWSTDGFWYPDEVTLSGEYNDKLSSSIEAELGIIRSNQSWST